MNARVCLSGHEFDCAYKVFKEDYLKGDFIQRKCLSQCPLECYATKFSHDISSHTLLGNTYVKLLSENPKIRGDFLTRNITNDVAKESVARLIIYYDTLSYTVSEEKPIWSLVSLIASIGGNLGLFLSVSLFSLCEIVTAFIESIFLFKNRRKI